MLIEWDLELLHNMLQGYHDKELITFLKFGLPIDCKDTGKQTLADNHKGATEFLVDVKSYLEKEISKKSLVGPFVENPFGPSARFVPLNTRPKRDSEERRIISDFSFPRGASINDGINKDTYLGKPTNLKYPSINKLVEIIFKKSKGCLFFKRDLKRA